VLAGMQLDSEMIFVNNGRGDRTDPILHEISVSEARLRAVYYEWRPWYRASLKRRTRSRRA